MFTTKTPGEEHALWLELAEDHRVQSGIKMIQGKKVQAFVYKRLELSARRKARRVLKES